MIGKTIAHYKILQKLGEGGMGVVYKAEDTKLDRIVALKFLPAHVQTSEAEKARFLQEAKAASAVNHANVCTIYDIQEYDRQLFIVMEYVEGQMLKEAISRGPLAINKAIDLAIQIADGLQEAHDKGIIHRDIKSENIMVNARNQIKIMDFGLAKIKGSIKLTKTSSTVGTLAYMAPEQIQETTVDARADIFSFGVVLYEILAGHLPFHGEHEAAMVYSIVNEEPVPIQNYLPDSSSELQHILNRALEKDPEDRYQTIHDVVIDLRRARKESSKISRQRQAPIDGEGDIKAVFEEQPGLPVKPLKNHSMKFVFWGLLAFILITVLISIYLFAGKQTPRLNSDISFRQLEIPFTQINSASLSRDGNWIAFSALDTDDKWSLYFMNASTGNPQRLVSIPVYKIGSVDISPDGSEILYCCYETVKSWGVYVVSSFGGQSRKITDLGNFAKWRPDGRRIGYILSSSFYQCPKSEFWSILPDGSDNRCEFVDSVKNVWGSNSFDWSPDGKSIAWVKAFTGYEEIFIHDLISGKEQQITCNLAGIDQVAWSTNNQLFYSTNKGGNWNIWMISADGDESSQVTRGVGSDMEMRISADNNRLLYLEQRLINNIWTADIDGRNIRQLTFDDGYANIPMFSPNLNQISFSMFSDNLVNPGVKIFIMQNDGSNRIQLPTGKGDYCNAMWSPDGKYMTYSLWAPYDSAKVYLVETSKPNTPKLIGKGIGTWWIDARTFITIAPVPNMYSSLYQVDKPTPIAVSEDFACEFPLPDGKHILVGDSKKGQEGWWLKHRGLDQDTNSQNLLPAEYFLSAWPSLNLRYLLYLKSNGEVWRISLPDGRQQKFPAIFNGLNPFHMDLQMSWNDERVVFLKGRQQSRLIIIDQLFR